jgi:inner membrane protein
MENPSNPNPEVILPEPPSGNIFDRNRNLLKGFMISFLILMLLIPTYFIGQLIRERQNRNEEVKREIATQWSGAQNLNGPILVIPYLQIEKTSDQKMISVKCLLFTG